MIKETLTLYSFDTQFETSHIIIIIIIINIITRLAFITQYSCERK
jgi:hypothetical protein